MFYSCLRFRAIFSTSEIRPLCDAILGTRYCIVRRLCESSMPGLRLMICTNCWSGDTSPRPHRSRTPWVKPAAQLTSRLTLGHSGAVEISAVPYWYLFNWSFVFYFYTDTVGLLVHNGTFSCLLPVSRIRIQLGQQIRIRIGSGFGLGIQTCIQAGLNFPPKMKKSSLKSPNGFWESLRRHAVYEGFWSNIFPIVNFLNFVKN